MKIKRRDLLITAAVIETLTLAVPAKDAGGDIPDGAITGTTAGCVPGLVEITVTAVAGGGHVASDTMFHADTRVVTDVATAVDSASTIFYTIIW